jgi:sigma-B regulation protein RsbU (phosphoserine phosphatase)
VVADVHQTLSDSMDDSRYVTAVYGELDTAAGTFSYVNCGHNPPLVIQPNGAWRRLPASGRAIGMFGFEAAPTAKANLNKGDVLVLYTDGVAEACDPDATEFGETRIARVLAESSALSARAIVDALVRATRLHTGREHYEDDFTVMVVKRLS